MNIVKFLLVKAQYRANITAQGLTFIINIAAFGCTQNYMFIWIQFACQCFLGVHIAKSPKFFDQNIFNHFMVVMGFYLVSLIIGENDFLYFGLIFIFTYCFYILKECGYEKSINIWTYVQALLIGTTFITFPFKYKILATIIGYFEAQIILNLCFIIFKNNEEHLTEPSFIEIKNISLSEWFNINKPQVRLAIRGSITAGLLYAICANFHDIRPNWAVVTAVSALLRDDKSASLRVIKGVTIGSLVGWPLAVALVILLGTSSEAAIFCLWLSLILALVLSFELKTNPSLNKQIASSIVFLFSIVCFSVALKNFAYPYLHLKVINSLIGDAVALIVLIAWEESKKLYPLKEPISKNAS